MFAKGSRKSEEIKHSVISFRISCSLQQARSVFIQNKQTILFNFLVVLKKALAN